MGPRYCLMLSHCGLRHCFALQGLLADVGLRYTISVHVLKYLGNARRHYICKETMCFTRLRAGVKLRWWLTQCPMFSMQCIPVITWRFLSKILNNKHHIVRAWLWDTDGCGEFEVRPWCMFCLSFSPAAFNTCVVLLYTGLCHNGTWLNNFTSPHLMLWYISSYCINAVNSV